ncbi:hypothetical protein D3C73_757410 [compost metagenome]
MCGEGYFFCRTLAAISLTLLQIRLGNPDNTSGTAPFLSASTGVPQPKLSIRTRPNGSSHNVGNSTHSACLISCCFIFPPTGPTYWILGLFRMRGLISLSKNLEAFTGPAIISLFPVFSATCIACITPLFRIILPIYNRYKCFSVLNSYSCVLIPLYTQKPLLFPISRRARLLTYTGYLIRRLTGICTVHTVGTLGLVTPSAERKVWSWIISTRSGNFFSTNLAMLSWRSPLG